MKSWLSVLDCQDWQLLQEGNKSKQKGAKGGKGGAAKQNAGPKAKRKRPEAGIDGEESKENSLQAAFNFMSAAELMKSGRPELSRK